MQPRENGEVARHTNSPHVLLAHRIEQGKTAQLTACLIYEERSKREALTAHHSCQRTPHPETASWQAISLSVGRHKGTKAAVYAALTPNVCRAALLWARSVGGYGLTAWALYLRPMPLRLTSCWQGAGPD